MHSEIQCCIHLSFLTERVVSANNDKPLAQFVHSINNVCWLKVAWFAAIDMEDLNGVLQELTGRGTRGKTNSRKSFRSSTSRLYSSSNLNFGLQLERAVVNGSL